MISSITRQTDCNILQSVFCIGKCFTNKMLSCCIGQRISDEEFLALDSILMNNI